MNGPLAGAAMMVKPSSVNICVRLSGTTLSASIDCVTGAKPPPPRPWMTRNTSIIVSEVENAQKTELIVKTATQIW